MTEILSQILSMTGFATAQGALVSGETFTVTLKSVNNRQFDLQLRLPGGVDAVEQGLRKLFRQHIRRGHIEFTLSFDSRLDSKPTAQILLDEPMLAAYLAA